MHHCHTTFNEALVLYHLKSQMVMNSTVSMLNLKMSWRFFILKWFQRNKLLDRGYNEAMMLFSAFRSNNRLESLSTGKVLQYWFENTIVIHSTYTDNAAMVRLFSSAYCLRKG
ncbi:hypothetical protein MTR_8g066155 [Medicago truncatula]|uniref:Uncharacterized protein n=1 Tax=Medicago truncatula TaxID=3880 RepID=A0A072U2N0_MEDTR|nr:hypothetical protein MTR_8g066155 [Medicago truncatula]